MAGSVTFGMLSERGVSPARLLICYSLLSFCAVGGTFLLFRSGVSATAQREPLSRYRVAALTPHGLCSFSPSAWSVQVAASPSGVFLVFLLLTSFEGGLGGYMAAVATLKAAYVPDELRATVYNLFRVPLNLIVVVINGAPPREQASTRAPLGSLPASRTD